MPLKIDASEYPPDPQGRQTIPMTPQFLVRQWGNMTSQEIKDLKALIERLKLQFHF